MQSHLYNNAGQKQKRRQLRAGMTDAERKIWCIIRNKQLGARFLRQYSVGFFVLDFFCSEKKLAIEIDGGQHSEPLQEHHDEVRSKFLNSHGIRVLRFWNNEVMENIEGVYEEIRQTLGVITHPSPPLS